jgi:hypothetical protein
MLEMQEGVDAASRLGDDVMLEGGEVMPASPALIYGVAVNGATVRWQPDRRTLREHMRVQIDDARDDQLPPASMICAARAAGIWSRLRRSAHCECRCRAVHAGSVDRAFRPDHQVELVLPAHAELPGRRPRPSPATAAGGGTDEKIASYVGHVILLLA